VTPERLNEIEELFHSVRESPAGERAELLARADPELRREVEALLRQMESQGLLDRPALEVAAGLLAGDSSDEGGMHSDVTGAAIGERFGPYKIESLLGSGGMGQVYKARDTRLGRAVAIKVLSEKYSGRFERESRAISSLNHPNICTLYDVGGNYLVMELVEGETLADRLRKGPLPLDQLLHYGAQIADALAAAHARGVIHRDLKPANIVLTAAKQAKVLDFGLAKMEPRLPGPGGATLPMESSLTDTGMAVGTVAYMSPEQARAEEVDARTDLFSFGAVLYEMATGQRAFPGSSSAVVFQAILSHRPVPPMRLRADVPAELERILDKALEKDRDLRYQHASEMRADLERLKRDSGPSRTSAPAGVLAPVGQRPDVKAELEQAPSSARSFWTMSALAAVVLVAAAMTGFFYFRSGTNADATASREIPLIGLPGSANDPSFSPDGREVVYAYRDEEAEDDGGIYVKLVGAGTALRLTDAEGDDHPAWSGDGQWVAFCRYLPPNSGVYVVSALGGPVRRITTLRGCFGLGWLPDGQHLVVSEVPDPSGYANEPSRLSLLTVDTGQLQPLTSPSSGSIGDQNPAVSPDGKTLAFTRANSSFNPDLYLMPIGGGPPRWLATDAHSVAWMPDGREIVFSSYVGRLWRIQVSGGAPRAVTYSAEIANSPAVALRGNRLAFVVVDKRQSIWRIDLTSKIPPAIGRPVRIESTSGWLGGPSYSFDGSKIAFSSSRSRVDELWVDDPQGRGAVRVAGFGSVLCGSPRWSPDGSLLAFDSQPNGNVDVFVVRSDGGKPRRITTYSGEDDVPSWSRDGKWIYFMSTRSGEQQIWKVPAETGESPSAPALQVTRGGGMNAFESADGMFLYYAKGRDKTGLWRKDLAGPDGREEAVLESLRYWGWWALAPKGIYFLEQSEPGSPRRAKVRLKFLELASRRITELAVLDEPVDPYTSPIAVSRDGLHLLYAQIDRSGSDIMLVENFR
jgi:eukaryotic-like serine/threonine-protein kinase